jgi:glutaredoxin
MNDLMTTTETVKLFWQPGCTSCLRTKEWMTKRGIPFKSVNVHDDEGGWDELAQLGPRTVPVVSRGDQFVFAQQLGVVAKFLGVELKEERLSPDELVQRLDAVLEAAEAGVRALPNDALEKILPGRNRSYRQLANHIFRIPDAFLEAVAAGENLAVESINRGPTDAMKTFDDVADYGAEVRRKVRAWWAKETDRNGQRIMDTYYGPTAMHLVFERTAWHSTQHTRQLEMVLGIVGKPVPKPLTPDMMKGLPLPTDVWG